MKEVITGLIFAVVYMFLYFGMPAAYIAHIYFTIKADETTLFLVGMLIPPVGIINGFIEIFSRAF